MPSKQFVLAETRRISGRGLFKVLPQNRDRHFRLYTQLIREPRVNFSNSKYNPDKTEYAKITWLKGGYVIRENAVNYDYQVFDWFVDPTGYLAPAMACIYRSLTDYLDYLAPFVGASPLVTDPTDPIYIEPLKLNFDEIRIVCRGDAALQCNLYKLEYDWQCPEGEPTPKDPPLPPPAERNTPGTPLDNISQPYDIPGNDDGNTIPDPSDSYPPLTPVYTGTWTIRYANNGVVVVTKTYRGNPDDTFEINSPAVPGTCDLAFGTKVVRNGTDIIEPVFNCNVDGFSSTIHDATFAADP